VEEIPTLLACHRFQDAHGLVLAFELGHYPSVAVVNQQERHLGHGVPER
jgi:hypothetical protein